MEAKVLDVGSLIKQLALSGQGEINHSIASAQIIARLADPRPIFVTGVPEGTQQNDE